MGYEFRDRNGELIKIGDKVRVMLHGDEFPRIGIVRRMVESAGFDNTPQVRVSSNPDPCSDDSDLDKPHWSCWKADSKIEKVSE